MTNQSGQTSRPVPALRPGVRGLVAAALGISALLASASGAFAVTARTAPTKGAIERTCAVLADDLSNGPDPDADPVGYALGQIRPVRGVKTSDTKLGEDIDALAAAFQRQYTTNDKKGTQAAVNAAGKALDAICPGAF